MVTTLRATAKIKLPNQLSRELSTTPHRIWSPPGRPSVQNPIPRSLPTSLYPRLLPVSNSMLEPVYPAQMATCVMMGMIWSRLSLEIPLPLRAPPSAPSTRLVLQLITALAEAPKAFYREGNQCADLLVKRTRVRDERCARFCATRRRWLLDRRWWRFRCEGAQLAGSPQRYYRLEAELCVCMAQ